MLIRSIKFCYIYRAYKERLTKYIKDEIIHINLISISEIRNQTDREVQILN